MKNNNQKKVLAMKNNSSISKLFYYIRPYLPMFALTLVLIFLITILDLLNPFVIKIAIDDHISFQDRLIYEVEEKTPETIEIDDKSYLLDVSYKNQDEYNIISTGRIIRDGESTYIESEDSQRFEIPQDIYEEIRQKDLKGINNVALMYLIIIVFSFVLSYLQQVLLNYTGQKIIYNIRNDLYYHIQSLSMSFFDKSSIGRLVTRVNNDTESLNELFTSVLVQLFQDIFTLIGIIVIMFILDARLALFSFLFVPILFIISIKFRNRLRIIYQKVRKNLSRLNSSFNEYISGMKTIQIFSKEEKMSRQFDNSNKRYLDTALEEVKVHAFIRPVVEIAMAIAIASLLYLGGNQVLRQALEIGTLYVFVDYIQRFFRPIFELTEKLNIIQSAGTSADRIFEILEIDEKIENDSNPKELGPVKGHIEFKNVWFAYDDENWILKDVSFTINPGESVAFVGSTGAGKTTIINLITRLYDIQKGTITIDGKDIKTIDKYELRRRVGVVHQDVFLFSGSVKDNIRLNNDDISDEDIQTVSNYVNAHTFIEKLPDQYDNKVSERGSTFSTGQRQLLSFARTLAFEPDVLVLDEATSNIDTQTELLIQDTINKVSKDRTTIVIAHRLSTVRNMDKIIVLDHGRIVEEGDHKSLLEEGNYYYRLYELQMQ